MAVYGFGSDDKRMFYSISEVSEMLGETIVTIRFWAKEFTVLKPSRNNKGNRLFTKGDLKNLRMIQLLLRDEKLTIEGAKIRLSQKLNETQRRIEVIHKLEEIKKRLLEISNSINS